MEKLKKAEREFISKRCEDILIGFQNNKKSIKIYKKLVERLSCEEREMFFDYVEELSKEQADIEEKVYKTAFLDCISLAFGER